MTAAPQERARTGGPQPPEQRSAGEIVGDISRDLSTLVRQEIDLAKTELKQEVTHAGRGAGMFGGAGVAGVFALLFASLALTFLLDDWMPIELGALITTGLWTTAAATLALRGRKEMKSADLQLPKTTETLKEDVRWAKAQTN